MLTQTTANTNEMPRFEIASMMTLMPDLSTVRVLTPEDTQEVQTFLSIRPVHTVVMSSFIVDNGIESDLNRGRFYGYRNSAGKLEGVALIGHSTLVEARSDEALKALAYVARSAETPIHLVMSGGNDAAAYRYCTISECSISAASWSSPIASSFGVVAPVTSGVPTCSRMRLMDGRADTGV